MVEAMSLFNQLLQHLPRLEFAALVKKHGADPVGRDAVLPTGSRRFAARNLQRARLLSGQTDSPRNRRGAEQVLSFLRQSASTGEAL